MAPLQPLAATAQQHSRSHHHLRRCLLQHEGSGSPVGRRSPTGNHSLPERSASFHGRTTTSATMGPHADLQQQTRQNIMRRPKTQPDLLAGRKIASSPVVGGSANSYSGEQGKKALLQVPPKVLVNVNVQRSLGALQLMASTDWTVDLLVAAAIKQYVKEGRRPPLPTTHPSAFGLHYSQFSLECLDPKEKLIGLGSRNFFLCPKQNAATVSRPNESPSSSSSCSKEADKASKIAIPWLRFMNFLL